MIKIVKDKRNFEVLFYVILLVVLLSVSSYGLSVGETKNIFTVGGITVNQLYVGSYTPSNETSSGTALLLTVIPIEIASIIIVILALRLNATGNVKAIALTLAIAVFLIVTFLVMNSMLSALR